MSTYDVKYNNVDSIVYLNCQLCLNDVMNSKKMFENVLNIESIQNQAPGKAVTNAFIIKQIIQLGQLNP